MRILLIHADRFSFRVTGETSVALSGELDKTSSEGEVGEALVVFMAAEKGDEADVDSVVKQVTKEILSLADQVGTSQLVVYPYAHLSSRLSSPRVAVTRYGLNSSSSRVCFKSSRIRTPFRFVRPRASS